MGFWPLRLDLRVIVKSEVLIGRTLEEGGCAKSPLEAAYFRLHKHQKTDVLLLLKSAVFFIKQSFSSLQTPAWGARGRVFESLRPDHIIQGVARFFISRPLFFLSAFTPTKPLALGGSSRLPRGRTQALALTPGLFTDVVWSFSREAPGTALGNSPSSSCICS